MEKVDLVIVGAEGVVENGGIINKVGASVLHRSLLRARSSTDDFGHPTTLYVMVHSSNPAYPEDSTIATIGFPFPLSHCSGVNQILVRFLSALEIDLCRLGERIYTYSKHALLGIGFLLFNGAYLTPI